MPAGLSVADVRAVLVGLPGVIEVHDLHVWALSTTQTALTAHVVTAGAGPDLIGVACRALRARFGIGHATLQIEDEAMAGSCALRSEGVI